MTIVSAPVVSESYVKGYQGPRLVHAVEIREGAPYKVLCAPRINVASIVTDPSLWDKQPVTCDRCNLRLGKLKVTV
jgi:hypothetical protein